MTVLAIKAVNEISVMSMVDVLLVLKVIPE